MDRLDSFRKMHSAFCLDIFIGIIIICVPQLATCVQCTWLSIISSIRQAKQTMVDHIRKLGFNSFLIYTILYHESGNPASYPIFQELHSKNHASVAEPLCLQPLLVVPSKRHRPAPCPVCHARQCRWPPMGSRSTRRRRSAPPGTVPRKPCRRAERPSSACPCSTTSN